MISPSLPFTPSKIRHAASAYSRSGRFLMWCSGSSACTTLAFCAEYGWALTYAEVWEGNNNMPATYWLEGQAVMTQHTFFTDQGVDLSLVPST